MEKLQKLADRLQASIDFATEHNEDFEASSWAYEEGVLLSHNEAKLVVELVKNLSIHDVMQWVAVEDKLPKEMEWVLAYDTVGKQVRYMRRIDGLEWQMGQFSIRDVSHWMPIPKPPCE